MPRIGIIGAGNIGSEIYKRVKLLSWDVNCIVDIDGIYKELPKKEKIGELTELKKYIKGLDILFLAIPTFDDGKTAFNYIQTSLDEGVPIVTCEKGALSNYFSELELDVNKHKIGYSATVGGGSRLLRYLQERVGPNVEEIHAVVNGTLNYIFDQISKGRSLGEVVNETQTLGYAEPGTTNPLEVINKEATGDVPMKTSILFNVCNLVEKRIKASEIIVHPIKSSELKKLVEEAINRRYIVSITRYDNKEEVIGGFKSKLNEWYISAGFKNINKNPLFRELIPSGVNNAILISEGQYGNYILSGPGAGAGPTANSMIIDAKKILKDKL